MSHSKKTSENDEKKTREWQEEASVFFEKKRLKFPGTVAHFRRGNFFEKLRVDHTHRHISNGIEFKLERNIDQVLIVKNFLIALIFATQMNFAVEKTKLKKIVLRAAEFC